MTVEGANWKVCGTNISGRRSGVSSQIRTGDHEWFPYYKQEGDSRKGSGDLARWRFFTMLLGLRFSASEFLPTEDSIRIGVTKPSHKRVPSYQKIVLESGLQSPPTREFLPTEDSIRIGLTKPSHKRVPSYQKIVLESGLQSPPTRDIICPYRGNLKFYLTFVRKCRIIRVASWSEVKPTPS